MRVELGVSLGGLNLIKKNIGNGKKKLFWKDSWLNGQSWESKYPRLFLNSNQKDCSIHEVIRWEGGSWQCNFSWGRH